MPQPRLLAILAHPDDESFGLGGTLARYACQGAEVHVCIVTDGAAGSYDADQVSFDGPVGETPSLAFLRRHELECACRVLGAHLHMLDYRDSGMGGMPDNEHPDSLYQADLGDVARDLVGVVRQVRPHVVVTHDPNGGYFHPDHIKVNRAVCRAWDRLDDQAYLAMEAGGVAPWRPARLYFTAIPRSTLKWFVRILRLFRRDPRRFGQNKDVDLTQVGVPDEQIHVRLEVGAYASVKKQASACHKTQGGGGALGVFPALFRRRLLRHEHFVQAQPPGTRAHDDLFESVELDE